MTENSQPEQDWIDAYHEAVDGGKKPRVASARADGVVEEKYGEIIRPQVSKAEVKRLIELEA